MKKSLLVFIVLFDICALLVFLSSLMIVLQTFRRNDTVGEKDFYAYQITHVDPSRNEATQGISTSFVDIGPSGTTFSIDETTGVLTLISQFGKDEYECYGSCYCIEETSETAKRRSSAVFQRGLMFLVAATTSLVARELARDYFQEDCERSIISGGRETCGPDSKVFSEVDECVMLMGGGRPQAGSSTGGGSKPLTISGTRNRKKKSSGRKRYQCIGGCMPSVGESAEYNWSFFSRGNRISRWSIFKRFVWGDTKFGFSFFKCTELHLEETVREKNLRFAYVKFANTRLDSFCRMNSLVDFEGKDGKTYTFPVCRGFLQNPKGVVDKMMKGTATTFEWSKKGRGRKGTESVGLDTTAPVEGNRKIHCRVLSGDGKGEMEVKEIPSVTFGPDDEIPEEIKKNIKKKYKKKI